MMKKLILNLILIIAIVSCKNDKEANKPITQIVTPTGQTETPTPDPTDETEEPTDFLSNADNLQKIEDELRNLPQFKGKNLRVFQQLYFYGNGRINIKIQDPNKPENIDEYHYENGAWGEPQPMQITGDGDMAHNTFDLSKTPFKTIATIYKNWTDKAATMDDKVLNTCDAIYANLWVPTQTIRWYTPELETQRAKYHIDFNLDGSVKEVKKN